MHHIITYRNNYFINRGSLSQLARMADHLIRSTMDLEMRWFKICLKTPNDEEPMIWRQLIVSSTEYTPTPVARWDQRIHGTL